MIDFGKKVGVLGAGQLGKMLALAAANWHLPIYFLDRSKDYPAGVAATGFEVGNFNDFEAVYRFGKSVDVLTIEIEHVNIGALKKLQTEGVIVHPDPASLEIIKDKALQKAFFVEKGIPTSGFQLFDSADDIKSALKKGNLSYPFVQKTRTEGYDGRGVCIVRSPSDLDQLLPGACVVEEIVNIEKELAVIAAQNQAGQIEVFPVVEMDFHPTANLVEFLICPANLHPLLQQEAVNLAKQTIRSFGICGLLAVEMFLTKNGQLLVNEVAPRPHNSGHHTIDSCETSQFEQHLRAILNLPLGSTHLKSPSVMVNLLGASGHSGLAKYEGMEECLALQGAKFHLYGKAETKPFRKMGHATVLGKTVEDAMNKAKIIQNKLRITT